jgi:hypothetical protein
LLVLHGYDYGGDLHETKSKMICKFIHSLVSNMSEKLAKIVETHLKPFRIRQLMGYFRVEEILKIK